MNKIFKARTSIPGGIFVNGTLIAEGYKTFEDGDLFEACKLNKDIEILLFDGSAFTPVGKETENASPNRDAPVDFEAMTRAELKTYLVEKGLNPNELENLTKADLVAKAKAL